MSWLDPCKVRRVTVVGSRAHGRLQRPRDRGADPRLRQGRGARRPTADTETQAPAVLPLRRHLLAVPRPVRGAARLSRTDSFVAGVCDGSGRSPTARTRGRGGATCWSARSDLAGARAGRCPVDEVNGRSAPGGGRLRMRVTRRTAGHRRAVPRSRSDGARGRRRARRRVARRRVGAPAFIGGRGGRAVRDRVGDVLRHRATRSASPTAPTRSRAHAARAGDRPRRRGDRAREHLHRDGRGGGPRRRDAAVRRRGPAHAAGDAASTSRRRSRPRRRARDPVQLYGNMPTMEGIVPLAARARARADRGRGAGARRDVGRARTPGSFGDAAVTSASTRGRTSARSATAGGRHRRRAGSRRGCARWRTTAAPPTREYVASPGRARTAVSTRCRRRCCRSGSRGWPDGTRARAAMAAATARHLDPARSRSCEADPAALARGTSSCRVPRP